MKKRSLRITSKNAGSFVFILIAVGVFISVMAEIFIPTYHTNPLLYTALGVLAGLFFKGGTDK